MIMVTVQVADLSHENFKSSRVMRWWRSRLSSCFGAKSSRERKPKWLSGLRRRNVQNAWKSTFSITPLSFDVPSPDYPCEYPQKSYTARNKSHWPTFPPVIVWVSLHSFFLWWAPKDASFLQHSAYGPFKVIQGRWFWHQSKGRMRLPISD